MTLTGITRMLASLSLQRKILLSETAWQMPSQICFYQHGILLLNGESMHLFLFVPYLDPMLNNCAFITVIPSPE